MSVCSGCGRVLGFDQPLCQRCGTWSAGDSLSLSSVSKNSTTTLDQVQAAEIERVVLGAPWDAVWGGGVVPVSTTLAGGPPGAGKTSMLLQLASRFAELSGKRAYFLSAEQSPGEIRLTANRLEIGNLDRFRVLSALGGGADVDADLLKQDPPACFVVDSISALCGKDKLAAVAISKTFKKLSSTHKAPSFLIAHMTKEHDYAGLMALQHEVDTLVSMAMASEREAAKLLKEGYELDDEQLGTIRVLIAWKNRFGATGKDHFLMMSPRGLLALPPPVQKPILRIRAALDEAPVAPVAPVPDAIEVGGQRLVGKKKTARRAEP